MLLLEMLKAGLRKRLLVELSSDGLEIKMFTREYDGEHRESKRRKHPPNATTYHLLQEIAGLDSQPFLMG